MKYSFLKVPACRRLFTRVRSRYRNKNSQSAKLFFSNQLVCVCASNHHFIADANWGLNTGDWSSNTFLRSRSHKKLWICTVCRENTCSAADEDKQLHWVCNALCILKNFLCEIVFEVFYWMRISGLKLNYFGTLKWWGWFKYFCEFISLFMDKFIDFIFKNFKIRTITIWLCTRCSKHLRNSISFFLNQIVKTALVKNLL